MISVIVPVYNCEAYLTDCLQSILASECVEMEIVVVVDGSTDGSARIAREIADKNSCVSVFEQPNAGLSAARNSGLDHARGEWIAFVDADDMIDRRMLSTLLRVAEDTDADIVTSPLSKFDTFPSYSASTPTVEPRVYSPVDAVKSSLYQSDVCHSAAGKIYRRHLFEHERFKRGIYYEDLECFYRVALRCRSIAQIGCELYFYRQQPESIMHRWNDRHLDVLDVTDGIVAFAKAHCPELLSAARDRRFSAHYNIMLRALRSGGHPAVERCWGVVRSARAAELRDSDVRLKNKAGALLSYLGLPIIKLLFEKR